MGNMDTNLVIALPDNVPAIKLESGLNVILLNLDYTLTHTHRLVGECRFPKDFIAIQ